MYRFLLRPRWVAFHIIVVAAIVGMISAGFWQLRRLDERRDFNAVIEARYNAPPVPLDELTRDTDLETVEWRLTTIAGTYLPDETFFVVNRSQNGRAGRNVVVPMQLDDGRILVVNRGFIPLQIDAVPDIPATDVSILGRVRLTQERGLGQLRDPAEGDLVEAQRVDLDRLAPQLPGEVVPVYVDLIASDPPEGDGLPELVAAPVLGEGNHLSYAFQWFIFTICLATGWGIVVRRTAKQQAAATHSEPDS